MYVWKLRVGVRIIPRSFRRATEVIAVPLVLYGYLIIEWLLLNNM